MEFFIAAAFYILGACNSGAQCEVRPMFPAPQPGIVRNYRSGFHGVATDEGLGGGGSD